MQQPWQVWQDSKTQSLACFPIPASRIDLAGKSPCSCSARSALAKSCASWGTAGMGVDEARAPGWALICWAMGASCETASGASHGTEPKLSWGAPRFMTCRACMHITETCRPLSRFSASSSSLVCLCCPLPSCDKSFAVASGCSVCFDIAAGHALQVITFMMGSSQSQHRTYPN